MVTLSYEFHQQGYSESKFVNGLFKDLTHTGQERFPWLRIDFVENFVIHEIEVFARSNCCGFNTHQLHDLDVKVGKNPRRMRLCGHYSGYTGVSGRIAVWCRSRTVGRYVQIQIVKVTANYLTPAEVPVWGKPAKNK